MSENVQAILDALHEISFCLGLAVGLVFAGLVAIVAKK